VLAGLSSEQVQVARRLLLALATPDGTRRVVPLLAMQGELGADGHRVFGQLVQGRLLTLRKGQGRGKTESVVELAHESLIHAWAQLARWLEESKEERAFFAEVEQAAELWVRRGRRPEELWQGMALAEALAKLTSYENRAAPLAREFLAAAAQKDRARRQRRRVLLASGMAVLALSAIVSSLVAQRFDEQRHSADALRLHAEGERSEALREGARAAFGRGDLLEARAKLRGSLETQDSLLGRVLWWRLEREPLVWRKEVGAAVPAVAFSPDGKTVAAAANARIVYLLDVDTQDVRFLRVSDGDLSSVAFSPDGRQLAAGTATGAITLFDLTVTASIGRPLLVGHTNVVWSVAFSPDGRLLASGSEDRSVRLWDASTGQHSRVLVGQAGSVRAVAFSPDGSLLASTDAVRIDLWDAGTWSKRDSLSADGHPAYCLAFSPDGKWLASVNAGGSIFRWDVGTGSQRAVLLGHSQGVLSIAISNDSRTIVSGSIDKTIRVWDVASSREQYALLGHQDHVNAVSLSPDGALLVSGSHDKSVRLWRMASRPAGKAVGHDGAVQQVAVSPDGRLLATGGADRTVRVWDAASGAELLALRGFASGVRSAAFSPDGRLLAAGDQTIRVWNLLSPAEPQVLSGGRGVVDGVVFSSDGVSLASAGSDKTVRIWDLATAKERRVLVGHAAPVASVAISPDGARLASGSYDRTIRLWDARTGAPQQVLTGHSDLVLDVGFDPDGKQLASASCDRTVRLWSLATGESRILGEHPGNVYSVAFHPDGRRLGSSSVDGTARIWDTVSGGYVSLAGHRRDVMSIRFTPDGKLAATTSEDGTVRLWDAETAVPAWRAPILVGSVPAAGIAVPETLTHLGWTKLGMPPAGGLSARGSGQVPAPAPEHRRSMPAAGSRSPAPVVEWRRVVELLVASGSVAGTSANHSAAGSSPVSASASASSGYRYVCLRTRDDHVQVWDIASDRILFERSVPGIERIAAIPSGCVVLAKGRARLHSVGSRPSTDLGIDRGPITALAWAGFRDGAGNDSGRVLLSAGNEVLVFDEHGTQLGVLVADVGQTAVGLAGGYVAVGFDDGNIQLLRFQTGHGGEPATPSFAFEGVPASAVTRIIEGPPGTLIAGYASGFLGLWSLENGTLLDSAKLHGPVVHLLVDPKLNAVTELGDYLVLDLAVFFEDYCSLMGRIWRDVPVVWERGLPVLRRPASHACARRPG
ncbi:MAG: hypothetical protein V2A73_04320, partial [Pseudomonadota bacterium]